MNKLRRAVDIIKKFENSKNYPRGGWDNESKVWRPHPSIEGGADTLAYGMKLDPDLYSEDELERFYEEGISDEEATRMVEDYANDKIKTINKSLGVDLKKELNPKQLAAILSYVHNVGFNKNWSFSKNLKKAINSEDKEDKKSFFEKAAEEMDINKVNGEYNEALDNRRREERQLFLEPYTEEDYLEDNPKIKTNETKDLFKNIIEDKKNLYTKDRPDLAYSSEGDDYGAERVPASDSLYDNMSFKEAFSKAMKDKGEGEVFKYRGKPILLKRAEPIESVEEKEQTPPKSLADMLAPYAEKMDDVVKEETYEEPASEVTEPEVLESVEEVEPISEFDPRELQLQRLNSLKESYMPRKENMFEGGGVKKEERKEKEMYGPSVEELQGKLNMLRNPQKIENDMPTQEEMNFVPEEEEPKTPRVRQAPEMDYVEKQTLDKEYEEAGNQPPKVEEPQEAPMTMESLEQEYRKLMKASESERKTAAWATAATQIASMLDKFSAVPVGIKPINFQADVNPAQMKELMALGKMKGLGQQMTPYQKEMLKITRDKESKKDKYLDLNKSKEERIARQQQINTMRGFLKDDPTYKTVRQQALEFDQVNDIIKDAESGNQAAIAALGTKLARAMGEVGVLTDTDVVRYVGGTSWGRKLKDWWKKGAEGEISEETLNDIKANIKTISKKLKDNESKVFERAASRIKSAYPEVDDKMVYGVLGYNQPSSSEKDRMLEWLEKNPDHPKADAVREKAKRQGLL